MGTRTKPARLLPGKASLFRNKVRAPISITLTKAHRAAAAKAMRRLGISRSDLVALLIESYADKVALPRE